MDTLERGKKKKRLQNKQDKNVEHNNKNRQWELLKKEEEAGGGRFFMGGKRERVANMSDYVHKAGHLQKYSSKKCSTCMHACTMHVCMYSMHVCI